DADADLDDLRRHSHVEYADGVFSAIGGEHEIPLVADERPRDAGQSRDRLHEAARRAVDDVHGIVGGVRDVDTPRAPMDGGMIEAAGPRVRWKVDVADVVQH